MTKIVHKFIDLVKKIGDRGSLVIAISISVVFDLMRFFKLCEFNEVVRFFRQANQKCKLKISWGSYQVFFVLQIYLHQKRGHTLITLACRPV